MTIKTRLIALTLALLFACSIAAATGTLTPAQQQLHDSVWYCMDLPKGTQITAAAEYYCKVEGFPLRLLLIRITPDADMAEKYGTSAQLVIYDTDDCTTVTCRNAAWSEGAIQSREDALHMVFSCCDSELSSPDDGILYADSEMIFPISAEDVAAANQALAAHTAQ